MYLARVDGVPSDVGQEIALVSVVSAIVGARLFFVFEHWDRFENDLAAIVTDITEGGITLYGGLIGAFSGRHLRRLPPLAHRHLPRCRRPGMILGQGLGRIGDLINGEHLATASDLPWAFVYVHPNTLAELGQSVHPAAGGYELVGDFVILGILLFVARRVFKVPGWLFCSYMILYSVMRFGLSEFRIDEQTVDGIPGPPDRGGRHHRPRLHPRGGDSPLPGPDHRGLGGPRPRPAARGTRRGRLRALPGMTPPPPVTLYTRAACPLCDEARALLDGLARSLGFAIEAVDIDADPALRSRYDYAVPVIAVEDEEIARAPVRPAALEGSLRERYR